MRLDEGVRPHRCFAPTLEFWSDCVCDIFVTPLGKIWPTLITLLILALVRFPLAAPTIRARGSNMIMSNLLSRAIFGMAALITFISLVEPALAGKIVPAPIVGAGLPGLAILGGLYGAIWLTRKIRNNRRKT